MTKKKKAWLNKTIVAVATILFLVFSGIVVRKRLAEVQSRRSVETQVHETPVGVRAITTTRSTVKKWLYGTGTARAKEREILSFEAYGRVTYIKKVNNREIHEGDRVSGPSKEFPKGDLLAKVNDRNQVASLKAATAGLNEVKQQLIVARANVKQAEERLKLANQQFSREDALFKSGASSKETLEKAENVRIEAQLALQVSQAHAVAAATGIQAAQAQILQAENELEKTRIYSPIDGVVAYKNLKVGGLFSQQKVRTESESSVLTTVPFVVIDPSTYEIIIDLPAYNAGILKKGQHVGLQQTVRTLEEEHRQKSSIEGVITAVAPGINPGGRSIRVRIEARRNTQNLRDGEYISCRILAAEKENAIVLPMNALIMRDRKHFVYVIGEDMRVSRRDVTIGIRTEQVFEIIAGLSIGERVVTDGSFNVYDGALVEIVRQPEGE